MEIEKYDGDGFKISQPIKINTELEEILGKLMWKYGYTTSAPVFRDLLWTSRNVLNRETNGKPTGNQQENLDNQRETVTGNLRETVMGNLRETYGKPSETTSHTGVSQSETAYHTGVSRIETASHTDVSQSETAYHTGVSPSETTNHTDVSKNDTSNDTANQISSDDFEERFTPPEISPEQFRLYVRRLEDENAKLKSALEIADKVLTDRIKEGNLSPLLYQSENAIHGLIVWVTQHFREYFPGQNVPMMMLNDVRKIYPNFPHYQIPNQV